MRSGILILLFFTIISCSSNEENSPKSLLQSFQKHPKLAQSFEELHRINRSYIEENYQHDFCDGKFDYLVDLGKYSNLHLITYHKNYCCLCIKDVDRFKILINKDGKYLSGNKLIDDNNEIAIQISGYLNLKLGGYTAIEIYYDKACSERSLTDVLEQIEKGYQNYLNDRINSTNSSLKELLETEPLRLSIY
ncbi:hypothetical protein [Aureibacter tunicatorum]|uniref:Lipoprotein n=1 Tax=Aureibacter tunicatorum TaxID=866807 RepID=A0AAE4BSF8_9BACT|nr:hypothetical protein [Aureibacter tunicatorum]MDR6238810.1 hypothetical protein [Aureibacter tunicatorum]BDD05263.1 hypothetical protein AUTU_27460 [Aureibacter tunicatorum]